MKKALSRREFLAGAALGAGVLAGGAAFWTLRGKRSPRETYLVNHRRHPVRLTAVRQNPLPESIPGTIRLWSPESTRASEIELSFFGHAVVPSPRGDARAVTFEQWGTRAAEVDLAARAVTREWRCPEGTRFFGHAAFSPAGDFLYSTEMDDGKGSGRIVVRDGRDLSVLGETPSFGAFPHECHLIEGGKVMVVVNSGMAGPYAPEGSRIGNVSWVELATGKLLRQHAFGPRESYRHFAISRDGWLACGGAPCALAIIDPSGNLSRPAGFEALRKEGELLSLVMLEDAGIVAASSPRAGRVFFWSYKDGRPLAALPFGQPSGVALDRAGGQLVVSQIDDEVVALVDGRTFAPRSGASRYPGVGGAGSHLTRVDL